MRQATDALRKCPTCGSDDTDGLIFYHDLADDLPGKVGMSDLDAVLEQHRTGRMLFSEFKPMREPVPYAQMMVFRTLAAAGYDVVWVEWPPKGADREFVLHEFDGHWFGDGQVKTLKALRAYYAEWWNDA